MKEEESFLIFSTRLSNTKYILISLMLFVIRSECYPFVQSTASRHFRIPLQSFLSRNLKPMKRCDSSLTINYVLPKERMFSQSVYDTIQNGRIAIVPEFLTQSEVAELQRDAQTLYSSGYFNTDALSSYGTNGKFDPSKDRTVLKLQQWKNPTLGNYQLRSVSFANRIRDVRSDLAYNLNRPKLNEGNAINKFGNGSTEISYTRFGPGAFLKRHVDEHHEELKGVAGWAQPTRRSLSWLIYLNDPTWDPDIDGGFLRCYERAIESPPSHPVGARSNGDLQIGWLRADMIRDPVERPVFLDAQHLNTAGDRNANCALYIDSNDGTNEKVYISKNFNAHPTLFIAGGELLMQKLYISRSDVASRFQFIEPPKSRLQDILDQFSSPKDNERLQDVAPIGGTLVMFDSVSLPHEVLPTIKRERWAASGWMHEDQQQVETHPHHVA